MPSSVTCVSFASVSTTLPLVEALERTLTVPPLTTPLEADVCALDDWVAPMVSGKTYAMVPSVAPG